MRSKHHEHHPFRSNLCARSSLVHREFTQACACVHLPRFSSAPQHSTILLHSTHSRSSKSGWTRAYPYFLHRHCIDCYGRGIRRAAFGVEASAWHVELDKGREHDTVRAPHPEHWHTERPSRFLTITICLVSSKHQEQ